MNMKRKIGICLLLCIVFFGMLFGTGIAFRNRTNPKTQDIKQEEEETFTEESMLSSKEEHAFRYIVFSEEGKLMVYLEDGETLHFNSGVSDEHLPDVWKMQLEQGIRFESEEDLFEFLEAYSS
jgi:DNA primase catalytic subunit